MKREETFGINGDYMTAGEDKLENKDLLSSQDLPGRESPPPPLDDRKGADMSLGEMLKELVQNVINRKQH